MERGECRPQTKSEEAPLNRSGLILPCDLRTPMDMVRLLVRRTNVISITLMMLGENRNGDG
jgi:hypothetical protein